MRAGADGRKLCPPKPGSTLMTRIKSTAPIYGKTASTGVPDTVDEVIAAIRATGCNSVMSRAQGINVSNMKLLGLSVSNGLVGMAGGMLAQYQGYSDVGMGTGMVVIGLASVIIGEVLFGTSSLMRRLIAVALGAVVYRMVIGVALYIGMPPTDLKLVSAVIVTIALAMGMMGESFSIRKRKSKGGEKDA